MKAMRAVALGPLLAMGIMFAGLAESRAQPLSFSDIDKEKEQERQDKAYKLEQEKQDKARKQEQEARQARWAEQDAELKRQLAAREAKQAAKEEQDRQDRLEQEAQRKREQEARDAKMAAKEEQSRQDRLAKEARQAAIEDQRRQDQLAREARQDAATEQRRQDELARQARMSKMLAAQRQAALYQSYRSWAKRKMDAASDLYRECEETKWTSWGNKEIQAKLQVAWTEIRDIHSGDLDGINPADAVTLRQLMEKIEARYKPQDTERNFKYIRASSFTEESSYE